MYLFEGPQFVFEGDEVRLPSLGTGDLRRNRSTEYVSLFEGEHHYAPVLGLTIFTANEQGVENILVGVRDPSENKIHPNVVSTPTMRIPSDVLVRIAADKRRKIATQTETKHTFEIGGDDWVVPRSMNDCSGPSMLQSYVDKLMHDKLGVPYDWGDKNTFGYDMAIHSLTLGNSRAGVTEDWRDVTEKVAMLNVLVRAFHRGRHNHAQVTRHYSDIRWVGVDEYRSMQDTKDLLPVFDVNAVELCIHGVCIATSRTAIDDMQDFLEAR